MCEKIRSKLVLLYLTKKFGEKIKQQILITFEIKNCNDFS